MLAELLLVLCYLLHVNYTEPHMYYIIAGHGVTERDHSEVSLTLKKGQWEGKHNLYLYSEPFKYILDDEVLKIQKLLEEGKESEARKFEAPSLLTEEGHPDAPEDGLFKLRQVVKPGDEMYSLALCEGPEFPEIAGIYQVKKWKNDRGEHMQKLTLIYKMKKGGKCVSLHDIAKELKYKGPIYWMACRCPAHEITEIGTVESDLTKESKGVKEISKSRKIYMKTINAEMRNVKNKFEQAIARRLGELSIVEDMATDYMASHSPTKEMEKNFELLKTKITRKKFDFESKKKQFELQASSYDIYTCGWNLKERKKDVVDLSNMRYNIEKAVTEEIFSIGSMELYEAVEAKVLARRQEPVAVESALTEKKKPSGATKVSAMRLDKDEMYEYYDRYYDVLRDIYDEQEVIQQEESWIDGYYAGYYQAIKKIKGTTKHQYL